MSTAFIHIYWVPNPLKQQKKKKMKKKMGHNGDWPTPKQRALYMKTITLTAMSEKQV